MRGLRAGTARVRGRRCGRDDVLPTPIGKALRSQYPREREDIDGLRARIEEGSRAFLDRRSRGHHVVHQQDAFARYAQWLGRIEGAAHVAQTGVMMTIGLRVGSANSREHAGFNWQMKAARHFTGEKRGLIESAPP